MQGGEGKKFVGAGARSTNRRFFQSFHLSLYAAFA